jgi:neutral ceramidase
MKAVTFGVATVDITPPVGVALWGYDPRPSESVGHPLRAEALACEGGNGGWILIGADVGAFTAPLTDRLRADIAHCTGLPPEAVMLTATHTHSGPHATDALWCERSALESAYFQELRGKLTEVAERAWRARFPGTLVHARTVAPALGCNRRVQKEDGTWSNEWSDPDGHHTGYYDPTVELVGVRRDDGALDALLVNFGCHPVCFGAQNLGISGDYVSYLKDALEAEGKVGTVLFTVAGHANIDPRDCVQAGCGVVRGMGEALAGIVGRAIPSLVPVGGAGAAAVQEPWSFKTTWALEGRMTIYFPHAASGATVRTALSAVGMGDLVLLGLPGETVSEYREKFQRGSPFSRTLLVSLANDFVGYLPTDEILKQGAYEAKLCPLSPMEAALTERVESVLKQMHEAIKASAE